MFTTIKKIAWEYRGTVGFLVAVVGMCVLNTYTNKQFQPPTTELQSDFLYGVLVDLGSKNIRLSIYDCFENARSSTGAIFSQSPTFGQIFPIAVKNLRGTQ